MADLFASLQAVSQRLSKLEVPFAFLGGAVVPLLVDDPSLMEFRPTDDVDVIVEIVTLAGQYSLEEKLRLAGFRHDLSEGAPICRWRMDDCTVDIIPIDATVFGMNSRWFANALSAARPKNSGPGKDLRVVTAPYFLATKLEAFKDRGRGDYYGSHDLEDIVTVIDGISSIVEQVSGAEPDLHSYLSDHIRDLLANADFLDALPGHVSPLSGGVKRAPIILQRLQAIAHRDEPAS